MEPFPQTGYGWEAGIGLPNEEGEFYAQYTFNHSKDLYVESTLAEFGIGFYFTGYQYGETFYQDGELILTNITLTLNGENTPATPTPEPATLFLFGSGLLGFAGSRKKAIKRDKKDVLS